MICLHGENHATHHTAMPNIPHQSRDLKDHSGKIPLQPTTHNTQKTSKQEHQQVFLIAGPIAQLHGAKSFESKHTKRQTPTFKKITQMGSPTCAKKTFYFLQI